MGFREEYLKFKQPSQERENFVFNSVVQHLNKDQIEKSMKPITVKGPNDTEITYRVMPDYVSIDGMRVPMSGTTAQRVADHFGFNIPNAQLSQKIYENADVKVQAKPLSGRTTVIDGKTYTGKDVVNKGVGYADFAAKYNDDVNQQLADSGAKQGDIVAGFAKDIVTSPKKGRLGLYGLYDSKGKPIQGGDGTTSHTVSPEEHHDEYCAVLRLVDDEVEVKYKDGKVEKKKITDILNLPRYETGEPPKDSKEKLDKGIEDGKKDQVASLATPTTKPSAPSTTPAKPAAQVATAPKTKPTTSIKDPFESIDKFLGEFSRAAHQRRRNIVKRAIAQRFKAD
jgi:hypothetical protein